MTSKFVSKKHYRFLTFVAVLFIIIGSILFVSFVHKNEKQISIQPTINSENKSINNQRIYFLKRLEFTKPLDWWIEDGINAYLPAEWFSLNPTTISKPWQTIPVFTVGVETRDTTLEKEKELTISAHKLINVRKQKLYLGSIIALKIEGTVNPNQSNYNARFNKGAKVKNLIFILDGDLYTFIGDVSTLDTEYEEIISSFKILSKDQQHDLANNFIILDFQECKTSTTKVALLNNTDTIKINGITGKWNDLCSFSYESVAKNQNFACDIPTSWGKNVFRKEKDYVDFSATKQICELKLN